MEEWGKGGKKAHPSLIIPLPALLNPLSTGAHTAPSRTAWMPLEYEGMYMVACAVFAWAAYSHFVLDVVGSVCKYLDIYCLTIKHRRDNEAGRSTVIKERKAQ